MKVFKFGGASVRDASAFKNVLRILLKHSAEPTVVVLSAMGKTTNALERLVSALFEKPQDCPNIIQEIKKNHVEVVDQLFADSTEIKVTIDKIMHYLNERTQSGADASYAQAYDQIASVGELLSTKILSAYIAENGLKNEWLDARKLVLTNKDFTEAKVDWKASEKAILKQFEQIGIDKLWITQGFIGGTEDKYITTLGREGSDYTAAIFANILDAEEVVIWKDVPGVLNADPKHFENTEKLSNISYKEAIELTYYGASVIHPKTIKPLQNKSIPLTVRSFDQLDESGSLINDNGDKDNLLPSYIFKDQQLLLSISTKDYSFVVEEHMSDIFKLFAKAKVKMNIMQNSALTFSVSVDNQKEKVGALLKSLQEEFRVKYNDDVSLLTIRHFNEETVRELIKGKEVLLEQRTRETVRFLLKEL
ncbi:MAG TPA: aspartate kinase [Flavobacteriales bacterium]|nr:aspartate kinase [Flavobacteriales bacterium]